MPKRGEKHFLGNINQKALIQKKGAVLLVQYPKSNGKSSGKWDLPGGRLNVGEQPSAGLEREVFEEVGAKIEVNRVISTGTILNLNGLPNFFVIYNATLTNPDQAFKAEKGEIAAAEWIKPEKVLKLPFTYPEYQEVLRKILII
jgi:ADP-ribose pyrophosphatase YjhB (NUDIX family)